MPKWQCPRCGAKHHRQPAFDEQRYIDIREANCDMWVCPTCLDCSLTRGDAIESGLIEPKMEDEVHDWNENMEEDEDTVLLIPKLGGDSVATDRPVTVSKRAKVRVYGDEQNIEKHFGIETTHTELGPFLRDAATALGSTVGAGENYILAWLREIVEIACKLKGYKATVEVEQVIRSGSFPPSDSMLIANELDGFDEHGVHIPPALRETTPGFVPKT